MHPTYPTKCAYVEPKSWTSVSPWTAANLPMMAALDMLQRLFGSEQPLVAWARGAGLAGVNALGPLRRRIARYAMGGA
jgi:2-polyprenyl-6-methoxyphenol hydroxylase-like FAD-dependent oxidoreductase